jgi:hypothetical protein
MVIGAAVIVGCGDDNGDGNVAGPDPARDSISIKSVTPSSGLTPDVETDFVVVVEYYLESADSGELDVGFNNVQIDKFHIISPAGVLVARGSGEHQFDARALARDWGDEGDFKVYVNLTEHPHGHTYTPLATDVEVLTFQ